LDKIYDFESGILNTKNSNENHKERTAEALRKTGFENIFSNAPSVFSFRYTGHAGFENSTRIKTPDGHNETNQTYPLECRHFIDVPWILI